MSHPAGLPDLFLDRSLGRVQVPKLLRAAGLRLVTLAEHYGTPADESVSDEEWLALVGGMQWVAFLKDARVRYNSAERAAIRRNGARCFCLSSQTLNAEEMASRFLRNINRIAQACRKPGPFLYVVHDRRIESRPLSG